MDRINFKSGTEVVPALVNENTKRLATQIQNNIVATRTPGVIRKDSAPVRIWAADQATLGIYYLKAYDEEGNEISVPRSSDDSLPTVSGLLPDAANGTWRLIEGGTPFTALAQREWTMVIRYEEAEGAPTAPHVVTQMSLNVGVNSGYGLFLRETGTYPGDIILGTITTDSQGRVFFDETLCAFSTIPQEDVVASVEAEDGTVKTVDFGQHINDFENPHNVTLAQLGVDMGSLLNHQAYMHSTGIRTSNYMSTSSALYPHYKSETLTNEESVFIEPLDESSHEFVVVNGETIYPSDLEYNTVEYDFSNKASDEHIGFYLVTINSDTKTMVLNGPYASETDETFVAIVNDPTRFPICSFQWNKSMYDTNNDDVPDTESYDIIEASWKDRRSFNNTSVDQLHPDEFLAMSQFAPNKNINYQIFNARLIGKQNLAKYPVAGKTLSITVDGEFVYNITFSGLNPMPMATILRQIWEQTSTIDTNNQRYSELFVRLNSEGYLVLCGPLSIQVMVGGAQDASNILGFSAAQENISTSSTVIKEVLITGELEGKMEFKYEDPEKPEYITSAEYWFGGNKMRSQNFVYRNDQIIRIKDTVTTL